MFKFQIALVQRQEKHSAAAAAPVMASYPLIQGHTEVTEIVAWDDQSREV